VAAVQWQGATGELVGGTGRAPGKAVGVGLTQVAARRGGGGGCFWRRSSVGRELWWPVVIEARPRIVGAEEGR
jgi:hypothetical protein